MGPLARTLLAAMAAALAALALAACGGDDDGGGDTPSAGGQEDSATTLRVGTIPIAALAPLYLGMEKGFFEEEGVRLEPAGASTGAAILPAVMAGDQEIGFSSVVSLLQAQTRGLPIKIIAQGSQAGPGESSRFEGVMVKEGSSIREPEDLAGKTIAVNSIQSIGPLMITAALEKLGVDTSDVEYTEIPFSDINAALEAGRVDAAYQTEPFLTGGTDDGGFRTVLYQYEVLAPQITIATYFTSEQVMQEQPEAVAGFTRAMNRSLEYATANPDEARAIVSTFTEIPPELAEKMVLPGWRTELDPARNGLELISRLAVEQGVVEGRPDLGELIAR